MREWWQAKFKGGSKMGKVHETVREELFVKEPLQ